MSQDNFRNEMLDPELEALLADLRNVPPRNPVKATRTKEKYLAAVKQSFQVKKSAKDSNIFTKIKEQFNMASPFVKGLAITAALFMVIGVLLFSSAGITAVAASNSLPGDRLYGLKTGIEQTRVQLTSEEANRVQLNLAYAQRRLDEIEVLIDRGRLDDLGDAVKVYEAYIQKALSGLEATEKNDLERYPVLYSQIAASLTDYALALEELSIRLGGNGYPPFDDAIRFSKSAGTFKGEIEFTGIVEAMDDNLWIISGHDVIITTVTEIEGGIQINQTVEVEGWIDSAGNIYAKEIHKEKDGIQYDPDDDNEFLGIVNEIHPDYWIINSLRFERTSFTEVEDDIKVGDLVEVEFGKYESGEFYLLEVDLVFDDDDMDDMDDDDMDDMHDNDDMDDMHDDDDMEDMHDDINDMDDDDGMDDMGDDDSMDDMHEDDMDGDDDMDGMDDDDGMDGMDDDDRHDDDKHDHDDGGDD